MMTRQMFVNLPVRNVVLAQAFYAQIGAQAVPEFSNEQACGMKLGENLYVMLLDHPFFSGFTPLPIADARQSTQMLLAISQDSRSEVDALLGRALQAGAQEPRAAQDLGFMYSRAFTDLDGHIWEAFWMDPHSSQPQEP